ncbi:glycerol-3-phosphate 1-O-acyltransferase PlsY [Blastochloris viridis]|uniref:Glycerol-3-phosphate acyltransferase n=1 Tax=Blastochloris viridis TaxID=1079 RepID=A0A0H5BEP2_BLAVI|nr:glycerol-3-phosphate 1-O-acyltransferase PlsY [Blastochloris viridis]ALK09436.1 putative glycerol-3-phosphate acyltransferase [Blastochloris viridis]BAS00683.1 acyl-phosphate:glycerol-3-phosphate O-acyltransferase PlsY [Blastochloris viridis]CUU42099.1 G3P acyltransferase [Blastochloris viridis]
MPEIDWTYGWPSFVAALALGYLLGAIPFGVIFTRLAGAGDLRTIGSGNIGATNVLRTGRKGLAAATLIFDALKGTAAVLIAAHLWVDEQPLIAGLGAFVGHLWPIWLKFKGGKGVATYLGVLFGVAWPAALVFVAVWLAVAAITKYSSLAALIASIVTPSALIFFGYDDAVHLYMGLTILLLWTHRANIDRLRKGSEGKIGGTAAPAAARATPPSTSSNPPGADNVP